MKVDTICTVRRRNAQSSKRQQNALMVATYSCGCANHFMHCVLRTTCVGLPTSGHISYDSLHAFTQYQHEITAVCAA